MPVGTVSQIVLAVPGNAQGDKDFTGSGALPRGALLEVCGRKSRRTSVEHRPATNMVAHMELDATAACTLWLSEPAGCWRLGAMVSVPP